MNYEHIAYQFSKKYQDFYQGKSIDEEVTQAYWHGLQLSKKRLEKLGVNLEAKVVENGINGPGDKTVFRKVESISEQQHKTTMIRTPVSIRRRYYKQGKKLAERIDYTAESLCAVMEKDGESKREVVCPSCGAIGSRESLYDGCDYCGKQFRVDAEERKVSAFHVFHDDVAGAAAGLKKNIILLGVWFVLMLICMGISSDFLIKDTLVIQVALSKVASIIGVIAGGNGVLLLGATVWAYKNKKVRMEKTPELEQLRKECKGFNFGKFVEDLEYKLKAIHFAEKQEDVSLYAQNDIAQKVSTYGKVLDCQLRSCKITGYRQNDIYHFIDTEVLVILTFLEGTRIVEKEEKLLVNLRKCKTEQESKSLVSFSCKGCGSSVNLLNGGLCDYCGKQLNLEEYDWVMVGYQSIGMKRKDAFYFYTRLIAGLLSIIIVVANISNLHIAAVAAKRGLENRNASVYVYDNEMIPSLENYGYAIMRESTDKSKDMVEYIYRHVDGSSHVMVDYPQHLVEENGFTITNESDIMVVLERPKEFSKGTIYVVIADLADRGYGIAITGIEE